MRLQGPHATAEHAPAPADQALSPPPITTAVIESRLASAPELELAAPTRPLVTRPATAKISPATVSTLSSIRFTWMPAGRAASGPSPTAYTCLPQAVQCSSYAKNA
jgi:hypothetical protein